jgi:guanidinoacetate N-methyltransferase
MSTRKICRRQRFDISVEIKDKAFISPPQPSQQNWLIARALEELADELEHLDTIAKQFISGSERKKIQAQWAESQAQYAASQLLIDEQQVMQEWERPYMEAMAEAATETHGDLLEVGFGMGISAAYIQAFGVRSHTIIECNKDVQLKFLEWSRHYADRDVRLVKGRWQDTIAALGAFDSIFFDTYPLSEAEFNQFVLEDVTFAAHFFATAAAHLRKGGSFTYYSNEIDTVSRRHQRCLLQHFNSVSMRVIRPLFPPPDCNYWWAQSMVLVRAIK